MSLLPNSLLGASLNVWVFVIIPASFVGYWILWIIYARTLHPLAKVPGDLWPSVSRTWIMYQMYRGDIEETQRRLHKKYGTIVRIAPDEVAVSDPQAISKIYSIQRPLEKTDWYRSWRPPGLHCQPDLFTETDEQKHSSYRRIVGSVYGLGSILKSEKEVDNVLNLFMRRIDKFAVMDQSFDFGLWLEMYAFDIIGAVFFGKDFGFIENSHDHGNYIHAVHLAMPFFSTVNVAPVWLRPFLLASAITIPKLFKAVLAFDDIKVSTVRETETAIARSAETTSKRHDVLSQLLAIVHTKGEKVNFTKAEVISEMWVGIVSGADSTSIALRAIFYYLLKDPPRLRKLRDEIDIAFENGTLSHPVQYSAAISLPYLSAVIKEASRMFPSFQVTMPRYAPAQGLEFGGIHIPAGNIVGMNPAVICHDKDVFGEDAGQFVPERWLESPERSRAMEKSMINFGSGTRTCTGKNLAMCETFKVVAEILRRYDYEMIHDGPWKTQNATFIVQTGLECRFKRREIL